MTSLTQVTNNISDVALVLEGGGMRGSYTAGVITTLLREDLHFGYVSGISAGSSNATNYVSRDLDRTRRTFVDFAADPRLGDLRTFLRGKGLFNAEYIYEESGLPDQALPFDWDSFVANPARMRVGAVRCEDGEMVYWDRADYPTLRDLVVRVRASSTMPVVMPITTIDGTPYVDGALGPSGGIPLDVAQADGFEKFFIVLTQERTYRKKAERRVAFFRRYFRRYPAVTEAVLTRHERYNAMREKVFELEQEGKAVVVAPETMQVSNGERSVEKLRATFELGLAQAQRELPGWRKFLGQ